MAYSVTKIGYLDIVHVRTKPIDIEQMNMTDGTAYLWLESSGPGTDGVEVHVDYGDLKSEDRSEAVCSFFIPEKTWKTFVDAVNAIDRMWDGASESR